MEILITEEQLSNLLTEGIEDVLYYYRSYDSLLDILERNLIRTSLSGLGVSTSKKDSFFNKSRLFFLSTTRNKNFIFKDRNCRIYLDKDKLKRKYKIVPFNYHYDVYSRLDASEHEDRVLTYDPYLIASSYIKRIDIWGRDQNFSKIIKLVEDKYDFPVYFFDDKKKYRIGNETYAVGFGNIEFEEEREGEIYTLDNEETSLFFSIFYLNDIKIPFDIEEKQIIPFYLKYKFIDSYDSYFSDFISVIDKMRSNKAYFKYLRFLAKKMKDYGARDIKNFIYKLRSKLIVKEYIENGSFGDLRLDFYSLETLSPLKKVDGKLTIEKQSIHSLKTFGTLEEVSGSIIANECDSLKTLGALKFVGKNLDLERCSLLEDLGSVKKIGGMLSINSPKIKSFGLLEEVGDFITAPYCESLTSLGNLRTVSGGIYLDHNTSLIDLGNLKEVNGNLILNDCNSLTNLGNITNIKKNLKLSGCDSINNLNNLEEVGGSVDLDGCHSLTSLGNLRKIGGKLNLYGCTSLTDLGNLQEVGHSIFVSHSSLEKEYLSGELKKKYPHLADKFEM